MRHLAALLVLVMVLTAGCGGGGGSDSLGSSTSFYSATNQSNNLLIVVEDSVAEAISASLDTYTTALSEDGYSAQTIVWSSGTAEDLRAAIRTTNGTTPIGAVLLVGDLPSAWYEQTADFGSSGSFFEQFPCDIFLMSLYPTWEDTNNNGIYDGHSLLTVDVPVSRITGTSSSINSYLAKAVDYRRNGSFVAQGAFIFKDDDWQDYRRSNDFRLYDIYQNLTIYESTSNTTKAAYSGFMSSVGAEFVYQWIHSSPSSLYFEVDSSYQTMNTSEVKTANVRASFYNLYDCSAARFTEPNLGATYLASDFGLAVFGTTKTGGVYDPYFFHNALATGHSWGEAFTIWYNSAGRNDDNWYLGMVIQGCPFLKVAGSTANALTAELPPAPPTANEMALLQNQALIDAHQTPVGSFEDYKTNHPQYF